MAILTLEAKNNSENSVLTHTKCTMYPPQGTYKDFLWEKTIPINEFMEDDID